MQIISVSLLELSNFQIRDHVVGCHTIAVNNPKTATKFILMNKTVNPNCDLNEPIFFVQKCVIGLLSLLLPPNVDNEKAAAYLRTEIEQNNQLIDCGPVRPNGLINDNKVTD